MLSDVRVKRLSQVVATKTKPPCVRTIYTFWYTVFRYEREQTRPRSRRVTVAPAKYAGTGVCVCVCVCMFSDL